MANLEENKQLIRDFYEQLYNNKNYAEAGKFLHEEIMNRHPGAFGLGRKRMVESFCRNVEEKFPCIRMEVTRIVAEGDFVWTHGLITGLPNGGQTLSVDIWRIEEGKLAEHWDVQQPVKPDEDASELL
jgi:predicted SnoaL-like aldol condensation-catalyzing enzyme